MITTESEFRKVCPWAKWRVGEKYNKITIIGFSHRDSVSYNWFVQCNCGSKPKVVRYSDLKNEKTKSCGCHKSQQTTLFNYTKRDSCPVNHNYFNEYTNENCYIAGLLAADGSIIKKDNSYVVSIQLADYDKYILEWISQKLECQKKLYFRVDKRQNNHNMMHLSIPSTQMAKDLMEKFYIYCRKGRSDSPVAKVQGVFSSKPTQLAFPPLKEKSHILSYIYGYFDGDGCLMWLTVPSRGYVYNMWMVGFAGNQRVLTDIAKYLHDFKITKDFRQPKQHCDKTYELHYGGQADTKTFMKTKQKYCSYSLPRKTYQQFYIAHKQHLADWDKKYANKKNPKKPVVILPGNEEKFYCF